MGSGYAGYLLRSEGGGGRGGASLPVRGLAAAIEIGGGAYGLREQYKSIQDRAAGQADALDWATEARVLNQQAAWRGLVSNQDLYRQQMAANHRQYAQDVSEADDSSASQAASGVGRGASLQIGAIDRGAGLELRGNRERYEA